MTKAPIFLCLPDFVNGIPIFLEIFALSPETPKSLFHENPPRFNFLLLSIRNNIPVIFCFDLNKNRYTLHKVDATISIMLTGLMGY